MTLKQPQTKEAITELFERFEHYLDTRKATGGSIDNLAVEQVCARILNVIYGTNYTNTNVEHANYPGVDLRDRGLKRAVQISHQTSGWTQKIKNTLEKVANNIDLQQAEVFILFCTTADKAALYKNNSNNIVVLTFATLIRDATSEDKSPEEQEDILQRLRSEFTPWPAPVDDLNSCRAEFRELLCRMALPDWKIPFERSASSGVSNPASLEQALLWMNAEDSSSPDILGPCTLRFLVALEIELSLKLDKARSTAVSRILQTYAAHQMERVHTLRCELSGPTPCFLVVDLPGKQIFLYSKQLRILGMFPLRNSTSGSLNADINSNHAWLAELPVALRQVVTHLQAHQYAVCEAHVYCHSDHITENVEGPVDVAFEMVPVFIRLKRHSHVARRWDRGKLDAALSQARIKKFSRPTSILMNEAAVPVFCLKSDPAYSQGTRVGDDVYRYLLVRDVALAVFCRCETAEKNFHQQTGDACNIELSAGYWENHVRTIRLSQSSSIGLFIEDPNRDFFSYFGSFFGAS